MKALVGFVLLFVVLQFGFGFTPQSSSYFSLELGELLSEGDILLSRNIFIFGASDGIKVSDWFSVNVQLLFSFPDEWFWYFRVRFFGSTSVFNFDYFVNLNLSFTYGIDNISQFVKEGIPTQVTNEFIFKYYGIFMPYFTSYLTLTVPLVLNIFAGVGWYGGMPILFFPKKEPLWGLPVGYPFYYAGVSKVNFVVDEVSIYYDNNMYLLSLTKMF